MMEESSEKLKGLQIKLLDDDGEEVEEAVDETDDEEEDEESEPVALGFLEKPENCWSLLRQFFPCKAGGVPAWLDPVNLPTGRSCLCDFCGEPLQFLLQIYEPASERNESAFHRTIFVFMCLSMSCLNRDQHEQWKQRPEIALRSVKVFRCQLPQSNDFYSSEDPGQDETIKPSGSGVPLCNWCGTWRGGKVCGGCKAARYCSENHQTMHWRRGHKVDCQRQTVCSQTSDSSSSSNGMNISKETLNVASNTLWPEYEIISEVQSDTEMNEDYDYSNSVVPKSSRTDDTINALMANFEGDDDKIRWASFQEVMLQAPGQVLRCPMNAGSKPIWPLTSGRPSKDNIPKCRYCDGPSGFEFQILPQMLYYFGVKNDVDSLDWATIVVYTCKASCDASVAYREEFAWVQLYPSSATVPQ